MSDPVATASLQQAMRDTLALATAPRPQDPEEFYYDLDNSVLDLDEEYPGLGECIIEWQATRRGAAALPGWRPPNFGQVECSCYEKEPYLCEILNQARQARAAAMSRYSQWPQCPCQSPQLGTGITNANSALIRWWLSSSHPHWTRNNANKPGLLRRPIPKTPPSGSMPNVKGTKTVTGDILGPGTVQIDKQSWIRHAARAGPIVGCAARVVNEAKVGSTPKARGAVRARAAGAMKCANLGCSHPSGHTAQARDAPRKIGPANH